ncbi:MAG: GDSL-type esterase/lipase family protein [Halobacteriota archaeon]
MDNEKTCTNCGAGNQPYAAVCADCGESFTTPARSVVPATPRTYAGRAPSVITHRAPLRPKRPSRRFNKRYLIYGVLVLLLLSITVGSFRFGSSGNTTPAPVSAPPHPLHAQLIVCVGDSITEGFADPNNWPYQLKARLGGDWAVVNQGVGGAKTEDMLARIDAALALNPHFVIIMGGTNDLANGGVPLATTQANIKAMCARVESYGAAPVLCTVIPNSYHLAQRDILNAWIAEYANLKGYSLIDFYAVIDNPLNPGVANPALVMSDGVHPNPAGYTAMGNAIDLDIFTSGR